MTRARPDGAPPRDDSVSSYVDAWVGAWLRETRADVASSPRGAWREVRVALENAGAHDADRGAFAPLKIYGRLGDPARDDLVALKQDSTNDSRCTNEARRRGGRGPRRRASYWARAASRRRASFKRSRG